MTREEAIFILKEDVKNACWPMYQDALDMAISALNATNYETDTEVRLAVTDRHKDKVVLFDAFGEVEYLPSEPMSHEEAWAEIESDLISRADAIERIKSRKEWCVKFGHSDFWKRLDYTEHFIKALPSAEAEPTQTEKCDWCIHNGTHKDKMTCKECLSADRPMGEWIPYKFKIYSDTVHIATNYKCNKCGYDPVFEHIEELHYCPNCGARMEGGNE